MAFGIDPNVLALSPAQILADEAEKRRQAIQAAQFAAQLKAQRKAQKTQERQFAANKRSESERLAAASEAAQSESALNLQKWQAEPERAMALEAYKASLKPPKEKTIDERLFEMLQGGGQTTSPIVKNEQGVYTNVGTGTPQARTGGLTTDEIKQRLKLLIKPPETTSVMTEEAALKAGKVPKGTRLVTKDKSGEKYRPKTYKADIAGGIAAIKAGNFSPEEAYSKLVSTYPEYQSEIKGIIWPQGKEDPAMLEILNRLVPNR
jgi:hypothetical protein